LEFAKAKAVPGVLINIEVILFSTFTCIYIYIYIYSPELLISASWVC